MSKISERQIIQIGKAEKKDISDPITIEEPLEIRLKFTGRHGNQQVTALAVTMRTPGDDEALGRGFLFTEGLITGQSDIEAFDFPETNVVQFTLGRNCKFDPGKLQRNFYATSSCGICGKASIGCITTETSHLPWMSQFKIRKDVLGKLYHQLEEGQSTFNRTGGIHAAALFDISGIILALKEDVGRHNAMDKLIGSQDNYPLHRSIVLVSGRASFELVQKAAMAGIPVLVSVGAPSSLAIDAAVEHGMTLVGFLKQDSFNIYACPERIDI